jgi:tetratricopeptide (TPR) repeat protein
MVLARSTRMQSRTPPQRRRMQQTLAAFLALVIHASVGIPAASAEEVDHFNLGYEAAQVGDFEQAVRHFSLAYEQDGDPLALYNLAQAYAASGDPVPAVQAFERLLELPRATAEQRGWATEALRVQRNRVGSVVLSVQPPTADVYLDGRLLPAEQRRRPLLLKVGEHTLVARLGANASALQQFSILGQQTTQLHLVVASPTASTPPPQVVADPVPERPRPNNTVSWVLGTAGAALLAGSGALWLSRETVAKDYNEELGEISALNPSSEEFIRRRRAAAEDRERVNTFGLAAAIAGAGGLAALACAWIAYEREEEKEPSAQLSPLLTPRLVGLSAVGRF